MRAEDERADHFRSLDLQRVFDRVEVAQAFRHFDRDAKLIRHGQTAGQHPVPRELGIVGGFALRNFALVVREDVIHAAAVNIECVAQVFA